MEESQFGESTFNMSVPTLNRIDKLLIAHHDYSRQEFYKGNPLYRDILAITICAYIEVRPRLTISEKEIGDAYRTILNKREAITIVNDKMRVPKVFIPILEEYLDWVMEMLDAHKMLMATSDDPGDAIE
jgi:hypothetical protein